jgi:hypothetical protein
MLENILLSAAYYESFSKFATALTPNDSFTTDEMTDIAENTLEEFYISADESGASEEDIKALGEELYLHVLAELDKHQADDVNNANDVKELEDDIYQSLMEEMGL